MIRIRPIQLSLLLAMIAIVLVMASLLSTYLAAVTIENPSLATLKTIYIRLFDLNREANIPTWFSSSLLILNAFILAIIAIQRKKQQDPYHAQWFVLAAIFLYLSIDEAALLHEITDKPVRRALDLSGYLYFAWIVPAICLLIILGVYIRKFLFHIPKRTRWLFLFSGAVFVGGAVGMEAIGAKIYFTHGGLAYSLMATLEESFEMLGLIIFLYALLDYIAQNMPEIVFSVVKDWSGSALDGL